MLDDPFHEPLCALISMACNSCHETQPRCLIHALNVIPHIPALIIISVSDSYHHRYMLRQVARIQQNYGSGGDSGLEDGRMKRFHNLSTRTRAVRDSGSGSG
jgi:hypothetical protein